MKLMSGAALAGLAFVLSGCATVINGTAVPFLVGTAACAAIGFVMIVLTEPKRMFAPMRVDEPQPVEACMPDDLG